MTKGVVLDAHNASVGRRSNKTNKSQKQRKINKQKAKVVMLHHSVSVDQSATQRRHLLYITHQF